MTLDQEIEWWTRKAFKSETEAAYIAFGVATGLKLAKADYGAKDHEGHQQRGSHSDDGE